MLMRMPLTVFILAMVPVLARAEEWEQGFVNPPDAAKVWTYWWWLNGAASPEGITRDFQQMNKQGIRGALLFDAGQAGPDAPRGPEFMSPQWRELYKHAVREADRLGIALGVNLCSGWNAGGAWVTPEHAAKKLVGTSAIVQGPGRKTIALKQPPIVRDYYRDIAVLASPVVSGSMPDAKLTASSTYRDYGPWHAQDGMDDTRWVSNGFKAGMGPTPEKPEYLQFDYPAAWPVAGLYLKPFNHCGPKDIEIQVSDDGKTFRAIGRTTAKAGEELNLPLDDVRSAHFRVVFLTSQPYQGDQTWNVQVAEIALLTRADRQSGSRGGGAAWQHSQTVDLTKHTDAQGQLTWDVPDGAWHVVRIGCTLHGKAIKCVGSGPGGPEIDTMSAAAMEAHFAETGAKLIADAGPLAGKSLQYFHIDSWELGQPTWTPSMREEFQRRRGYDPLFYMPALLRKTVDSPEVTERFLNDYRRTAADLVVANYYGRLRELTLRGGLRGTHPESGGPMFTQWIDALECEGINDIPMGEFWKRNSEPDGVICHQGNPSLKQAANAAHIYGKRVCQAEAFTSFGCDWIDDPWSMKDIGDAAFCEGLTRNMLCFWIHQPRPDAKPGFQWAHVGTHFDCNLTWWDMSHAWLAYLARCQHLLRQGLFVADFAYFQGEQIPAFLAKDRAQQPLRPSGFDYDVLNPTVLLDRAKASDGKLTLPDGMSYRYLVLPHDAPLAMSPRVLRKVEELVQGGVTVIGPRPARTPGLTGYPQCDSELKKLADALWGPSPAKSGQRKIGAGRLIWGRTLDEVVQADKLPADIELRSATPQAKFDWIHRRRDDAEIYFVSNQASAPAAAEAVFRTVGKLPELWDAVTGEIRPLPEWQETDGRTALPLSFAPRQSWFVVFRKPAGNRQTGPAKNFPDLKKVADVAGPWEVSFDAKWGGPPRVTFAALDDWSKRPEPGIRYYSGTAVYRRQFDLPATAVGQRLFLDLGAVKNLAQVKVNDQDCGVVWTAPWRAEITKAVRPGANDLQIDVVNLWPNRLIGDGALPEKNRLTVTNVKTYYAVLPPMREYSTYRCPICDERRTSGQPPNLLPSGLLGPVALQSVDPQ